MVFAASTAGPYPDPCPLSRGGLCKFNSGSLPKVSWRTLQIQQPVPAQSLVADSANSTAGPCPKSCGGLCKLDSRSLPKVLWRTLQIQQPVPAHCLVALSTDATSLVSPRRCHGDATSLVPPLQCYFARARSCPHYTSSTTSNHPIKKARASGERHGLVGVSQQGDASGYSSYCSLKTTGSVKATRTALPRCLPGIHLGKLLTTRSASSEIPA